RGAIEGTSDKGGRGCLLYSIPPSLPISISEGPCRFHAGGSSFPLPSRSRKLSASGSTGDWTGAAGRSKEGTMKHAFDHIGIPTTVPQAGESWVEFSKVWVTNPRRHPQRIEYLRPKDPPQVPREQAGLWKLWNWPHIAYRVDDLQAALQGEQLVYGPFDPGGF